MTQHSTHVLDAWEIAGWWSEGTWRTIHTVPTCGGFRQFGDSGMKSLRCSKTTSPQLLLHTPSSARMPTSFGENTTWGKEPSWVARGLGGCPHWVTGAMLSMHWASQILRTCCSNLSAWQRGGFVLPNQHIPIRRSTELPSFLTEGDNFRILCSNVHLTPAFQHMSCNLQPERNLQLLQPLDHKRHVGNLREETCRILEAGSASRLTVAMRQPPALQKADSLQVS